MQITFELVIYNAEKNNFEQDKNTYEIELTEEEVESYTLHKDSDMSLYAWFRDTDSFVTYMQEEVYLEAEDKTFAISDINGSSFIRFYFFKITSGDTHYEYFKKLFKIFEESDWQDREDIGEEILEYLSVKQKELMLEFA